MSEIGNSVSVEACAGEADGALERRLLRTMVLAVVLASIASAIIAPWRVTAGLMLGGGLSLLNYHWLRTSIVAVLSEAANKPTRFKLSRYLIRYFVIGSVVLAAYKLQIVSLPATIAGLCSFVIALLVEAFRQFYFAIIYREGTH
jgi:hypothetical protein